MRRIILALMVLGYCKAGLAQKRPLDYAASKKWPYLQPLAITNDGKYVAYKLNIGDLSSDLVVEALAWNWNRTFPDFFVQFYS